ncbi:hypothetical protein [Bartonella sp. AR 15-3]|uniref:hypothetical protein n=1 Tax=Bartonella sp. AR 15-3 TaxID=545617 RepID=UPI00099A54AD|nr:hypothetical protein [Bartonella sp. AR 15-3]OPB31568.1 hypothetical protein BAR153v2_005170 [Bartonella sp. AR 15-3]
MAELPPLIHRKNTKVIGHISDYTPEQLQELFSKNKERLNGSIPENKEATGKDALKPTAAGAFGWGAVHGAAWGYDDEVAGALAAGPVKYWKGDKEAVKKYDEVAKRWRDYQKAADRDHPYLSIAGNVAGSAMNILVSPIATGAKVVVGSAMRAAPYLMRAAPYLWKGRSAASGAKMTGKALLDGAEQAAAKLGRRAAKIGRNIAAPEGQLTGKALLDGAKQVAKRAAEKAVGNQGAKITSSALAAGERAAQSALAEGAGQAAAKAAALAARKAAARKEAAKFKWGRAIGNGAIYGAIAGSGEGEGFWNTLGTTGTGAVLGVAAPFAIGGISKAIPSSVKEMPSAALRSLGELVRKTQPATHGISPKALREIRHSLGDDVMDNLEQTLKRRGPDSMIIDLHDGLAARAFEAAQKDHDAYSIVRNRLGARQNETYRRIDDGITRVLGPKVNTNDLQQEIINRAKAKAGPLYEKAKAMPIAKTVQEKLRILQKRPAFQDASEKALVRVLNDLDSKVLASNSSPQLDMRLLHKAKEVLDDKINSAAIKGERGYSRELMNVKQELLDVLETSSPGYAKARNLYRSELEIGDALSQGKEALKKNIDLDTIKSQLAGMSALEQDAFKKGVRGQIETASKNANNPEHNLLSLFDTQNTQEKLQHIYGENKADQLMKILKPEAERSKLFAQLPKHIGEVGERAAQNDKNTKNLSPGKALMKFFTGPWANGMRGFHKDTERDIAALITAREKGNIGLSRKKAVELLKKFHEAEKKRLIKKEDVAKFISLLSLLLNDTAVRRIANK